MLVNGAEVKEIEKVRSNKKDGGGLGATNFDPKKSSQGGSDPVGNPGPVSV
jgi:cell division protease FtsH